MVDLRNVSYLDSTGIICLIQAHKHAKDEGKAFSLLINRGGHLKKLFDIAGLSSFCDVKYASENEALERGNQQEGSVLL